MLDARKCRMKEVQPLRCCSSLVSHSPPQPPFQSAPLAHGLRRTRRLHDNTRNATKVAIAVRTAGDVDAATLDAGWLPDRRDAAAARDGAGLVADYGHLCQY